MPHLSSVTRSRCLLTWLLATVAAALVLGWVAPDLATAVAAVRAGGGLAGQPFEATVVWLASGAVAGCAAWGWAAISVVVGQALAGTPGTATPAVPHWLRSAVLAACGLVIVGAGSAAHADDEIARARSDRDPVLAGLPAPDRAVGAPRPAPPAGRDRIHTVRPGDTLWEIAAADLGGRPDNGRVSTHWPRIHALNRAVIGADPHLIQPGQELRMPTQHPTR